MAYKHLSVAEREKIQRMRWEKRSIRYMASALGRSPASISRELRRNNGRKGIYVPRAAHERALAHRAHRGRKERLKNKVIRSYVARKLKDGYSPEQIAGTLPLVHRGQRISHDAIYQYIYAQVHREGHGYLRPGREDLRPFLKRRHKRRVRKGLRGTQKVPRFKGRSIEERPEEVEERIIPGHWEGDSIISKKSSVGLNTLVERVSGMVFITRIENGTARVTRKAVARRLRGLPPALRKTLTVDNGPENAEADALESDLPGLFSYFAHPYASYERGTNENTNGLIRWYVPKGTDLATISSTELRRIERALNTRPRKRLGWKTPLEVFRASVALRS